MTSQLQRQLSCQPAKLFATITSWHQLLFFPVVLSRSTSGTAPSASREEIAPGTQALKLRRGATLITLFFVTFVILMLSNAGKAAAEDVFRDICVKAPTSTACQENKSVDPNNDSKNPFFGPNGVLTTVVNVLGILVGTAAVVSIMVAGIKFITSGNNPQEVTNARELVIYALVALFVVAFSQILVRFFLNKVF